MGAGGETPPGHPTTSEASPQTAEARNHRFGKQQRVIGRQGKFTQGPAVCQADRRRPLRQGPIGFRPAGHPESGWSDKVSADVERTPDSTSSSKNLTQTFRSQRPKDR
jgi:hypothetical protein